MRVHCGPAFVNLIMTHRSTVRPAMTALAAVIAMSSTALLAQSVTEPVVTTPTSVVDTAPPPAVADPVAPAPAAEAPTAADPLAAEPTKVTTTHKATTKATTVKTTAVRAHPAATHAAPAAATVAAAPAIAAPVPEAPVAQPLPPPTAIAAEPVAQPATASMISNDMLPIAGIGGLGLLLLAGTGLVVRRRRRRAQEAEDAAWQEDIETAAEPVAEPAMVAEPVMAAEQQPALELSEPAFIAPAPAPAAEASEVEGPVTDLPVGFDLSRFGYNVQQAYKGPTPDNPSLSLKHRLRRASGMDQQERKLDAEVEAATGEPVLAEADASPPAETPAAKPPVVRHVDGDFMFGRAGKKSKLNPTYTH